MYKLRKRRKQHFCQRVQKYWSILLRSPLSHDPVTWLPVGNKERAKNAPLPPRNTIPLAALLCTRMLLIRRVRAEQRRYGDGYKNGTGKGCGRGAINIHKPQGNKTNRKQTKKRRNKEKQTNKEVTSDSVGRVGVGNFG